MKRHKKDRYKSPQFKRRKNKSKKRKKEKNLKKYNPLASGYISDKQYEYFSSPKKMEQINVKSNEYTDRKNTTKEVSYVLKNHSITKRIESSLPLNIQKNYNYSMSTNKLAPLEKCDRVKLTNNRLHTEFICPLSKQENTLNLYADKKSRSIARNLNKSRSRSKCRSRSISRSRLNLYYCKHSSNCYKRTSYDKCSFRKRIVSCKYNESMSPEKLYQITYPQKNSITPEIICSKNRYCKVSEESNNRSKFNSRQLMLSCSSLQKHYDRYIDILKEVKKILKKDAISKRKLKHIFKRQRVLIRAPCIKLHSSSEDELYNSEDDLKHKKIGNQMKFNSFKRLHCGLTTKSPERLGKIGLSSTNSMKQENKILCNNSNLFSEKLTPSTFISNITAESNLISRTPSPALPLVRDEAVFNDNTCNAKLHHLSLRKINVSEKSTILNSKLYNSYEKTNKFSKYLTIENDLLNTSNKKSKSFTSCKSLYPFLSEKDADSNFSKKKDLNIKETFSFYQLSSSSQSLTPYRSSNDSRPWSQIFLLQNKTSNVVLKEDIEYSKCNKKTLTKTLHSSPSKTSITQFSRSRTPRLKSCLDNIHNKYRTRSRSISFSKTSRSISRSLSRNSENERKRSCSKSSSHSFLSSKSSRSRSSCSSRSTFSSRISRPASSTSTRSRSTSIPRRYGSPSFLDRRRITSARKRPIPYHRPTPSPLSSTSSINRSNYSGWSPGSNRSSKSPSCSSSHLIN